MAKTMSFATVHYSVAFTVAYVMTGSAIIGGTIALVEPAINTVAYHFHEQVWKQKVQTELPNETYAIQQS